MIENFLKKNYIQLDFLRFKEIILDQIQASCPECYTAFGFPINSVGQYSECPECGAEFQIEPDETIINDHYFNPPSKAEKATPMLLWGCGCLAALLVFLILGGIFGYSILAKSQPALEEDPNDNDPGAIESQSLIDDNNTGTTSPEGPGPAVSADVAAKQETFKAYLQQNFGISEVSYHGANQISVVLPGVEYRRGRYYVKNNIAKKIATEYISHVGVKPVTCIVLKDGKMFVKADVK